MSSPPTITSLKSFPGRGTFPLFLFIYLLFIFFHPPKLSSPHFPSKVILILNFKINLVFTQLLSTGEIVVAFLFEPGK